MKNDAGSTQGEEGAVLDDATLLGVQLYVANKSACIAVVVLQGVAQIATLVARNGDGAMVEVNTGVYGLERSIDRVALLITSDDVVAHLQGNDLLVVEDILNDNDAATFGIRNW